jgi:hypothetical protein
MIVADGMLAHMDALVPVRLLGPLLLQPASKKIVTREQKSGIFTNSHFRLELPEDAASHITDANARRPFGASRSPM